MLEELRIRGLGVISDATLELGPGFTVVTGETGAGKTMVVAGLGLLFGNRADASLVRTGQRQAVVEGRLTVPNTNPALARALAAGAEQDDDGTLLVSRTISSDGRSRAHVGGSSVPVGVLAALGDDVVTIHGQAEQLRLLRPAEQRAALDRFAGPAVAELLARYRDSFERWQLVVADLVRRTSAARDRIQEADLLRHGVAEISASGLQPGEDEALRAEAARLEHAEALRRAAAVAAGALVGDPAGDEPDVVGLLGVARRALEAVADHDPALADLAKRIAEIGYLAADAAGDLASYADALDIDPARLEQVQERRAAVQRLVRKYADTVDGVLAWAASASVRLDELDSSADRLAELTAERDAAAAEAIAAATALSAARAEAASRFSAAVTSELRELALPHALIDVQVRRRPVTAGSPAMPVGDEPAGFGPDGADEVELVLVPHGGAPARPVQKGASGGELSRVMLAIEVVFAGADRVPTLVFDEVDAGVGGRAAVEVGRRLARLAAHHQVLAVTHLPQVAAFADRHLVVGKDDDGAVTNSSVGQVDGPERVRELARMLAGLDPSETGLAHAEELLRIARRDMAAQVPPQAGAK